MVKENFKKNADIVLNSLINYLEESEKGDSEVIIQKPTFDILNDLKIDQLIQNGGLTNTKLESFTKSYLDNTTKMHHPHYMAHQVSVPHITEIGRAHV